MIHNIQVPPKFSIDLIEQAIIIIFELDWYQEDISILKKSLLSTIEDVTEIEHMLGADRESIRLVWGSNYFTINFECVSQSCWIVGDDQTSSNALSSLYDSMVKK